MFSEDELVPISALQHMAFCERQCALIHVEQAWEEIDEEVARGRLDGDSVTALKEVVAVTGIRRDPGAPASISGLFKY